MKTIHDADNLIKLCNARLEHELYICEIQLTNNNNNGLWQSIIFINLGNAGNYYCNRKYQNINQIIFVYFLFIVMLAFKVFKVITIWK